MMLMRQVRRIRDVALCIFSFSSPVLIANAATIAVPDAAATIQAAVNLCAPGDTVLIRSGVYSDCSTAINNGFVCAVISNGIVLRGETGHPADVIIDLAGAGGGFYLDGVSGETRIEALSIIRGAGPASIGCRSSRLVIRDCFLGDRTAAVPGGIPQEQMALFCADLSEVEVYDTEITNNNDPNRIGGAVDVIGSNATFVRCRVSQNSSCHSPAIMFLSSGLSRTLVVEDCDVSENVGDACYGSGILLGQDAAARISRTTFRDNVSRDRGAVVCGNGFDAAFIDCTFERNTTHLGSSTPVDGASAIYAENATVALSGCRFVDNVCVAGSPNVWGGAVTLGEQSHLSADRCEFDGNTSGYGGPDGAVGPGSSAVLFCCETAPVSWSVLEGGSATFEDCNPIPVSTQSWGNLKALFR